MPFDPDASFGKSLFFGEILEDQLFPYPQMPPDQVELVAPICEAIDKYMSSIDSRKLDRAGELPKELLQSLREMGLFGLIVPEEHGGLGLSNTGYARIMQQVAGWDGSIAVTIGAHSSIGFKGLLLFGTDEQKKKYLPRLATGELIAAFCLTEPGSGSDAFSIKTTARREGDVYVLDGRSCGSPTAASPTSTPSSPRPRPTPSRRRARSAPSSSPAISAASRTARTRTRWASARRTPPRCSSTTCAFRKKTCSARRARASRWR